MKLWIFESVRSQLKKKSTVFFYYFFVPVSRLNAILENLKSLGKLGKSWETKRSWD